MSKQYSVDVNGEEAKIREAYELIKTLGHSAYNDASLSAWIKGRAGYLHFGYDSKKIEWDHMDYDFSGKNLITIYQLRTMVNQYQGLISGAEALSDITNVQHAYDECHNWHATQFSTLTIQEILKGKTTQGNKISFRLKPRTITINIEIPAPFVPKDGDKYWHISLDSKGHSWNEFESDKIDANYTQFGVWRTEDEIKQVVAALRGALCP